MAPRRKTSAKKAASHVPVRVSIDVEGAGEPYYVNYAEVAAGQYDVELVFGRVPAKPTAEQIEGAKTSQMISVPAAVRIVMPLAVLTGLRDALTSQIESVRARENERDNPA